MTDWLGGSFGLAAQRVVKRYERIFGRKAGMDETTIKSRWYRRGTCRIVRMRIGGGAK